MKKAKIMLMAIAVLAVVGGALAFKAAKFVKLPYGATCDINGAKVCSLNTVQLFSTTTIAPFGQAVNVAPTTKICASNADCTTRLTVFN